jgi:FkbM family methyltransferase
MIPKTILQTSKTPYPEYVNNMWKERIDPTWTINWFDDTAIIKFFRDNPLPEFPNIIDVFHSFQDGGHKADLFRYYYLYLNGGFFMDSDLMTHVHMNELYSPEHDHILVVADIGVNRFHHPEIDSPIIFNGIMGCVPGSQIIYEALKNAYSVKLRLLKKQRLYFVYMLYVITEKLKDQHDILFFEERIDNLESQFSYTVDSTGRKIASHFYTNKIIPNVVDTYLGNQLIERVTGKFNNREFPFVVHHTSSDKFVSAAIATDGVWEPRISRLIVDSMKSDGVFVDIGANIGWHSKIVQNEGYDIIAFEPQLENYNILKENCTKVGSTLYTVALGEKTETLLIERNPINYGDSFISETGTHSVSVVRLDDIMTQEIIAKINVVKMDVQGFETKVINGATNFFDKLSKGTTIIIEVSPWNKNCDLTVIDQLRAKCSESYALTYWTEDVLTVEHAIECCRKPVENGVPERFITPSINLEFDMVLIK